MIVELDRFEQEVNDLEKKLDDVASAFDVDAMHDELDQLHSEMEQPDFWNNLDRAQKVNQRISVPQGIVDAIEDDIFKREPALAWCRSVDGASAAEVILA